MLLFRQQSERTGGIGRHLGYVDQSFLHLELGAFPHLGQQYQMINQIGQAVYLF